MHTLDMLHYGMERLTVCLSPCITVFMFACHNFTLYRDQDVVMSVVKKLGRFSISSTVGTHTCTIHVHVQCHVYLTYIIISTCTCTCLYIHVIICIIFNLYMYMYIHIVYMIVVKHVHILYTG